MALWAAFVLLGLCLGPVNAVDLTQQCGMILGAKGPEVTVIAGADPGQSAQTSTAEVQYYLSNVKNKKVILDGVSVCPHITMGELVGSKVLVITTGINSVSASTCLQDLLQQCGPFIKEIIFSGTAGWSMARGGIINNGTGGCSEGKLNNGPITRLGDVCVSPYAVNWECRLASWSQQCGGYPDLCYYPEADDAESASFLYGQCQFVDVSAAQLALTNELMAAVKGASNIFPSRDKAVKDNEQALWSLMQKDGNSYAYSAAAPPTVWDYHTCMEIDGQFFWSGVPWDMDARKYVADTLNIAFNTTKYTQIDTIAVSAMEGVGVAQAMSRYAGLKAGRRIPYTMVRGNSDWVHQPIAYNKTAKIWSYSGNVAQNVDEGYKYAIVTTSATVMRLLQVRCLNAGMPKSACTFTINY